MKHLHLLPHELEDYEEQVEKVLRRYVKRLQWLLSGKNNWLSFSSIDRLSICSNAVHECMQ